MRTYIKLLLLLIVFNGTAQIKKDSIPQIKLNLTIKLNDSLMDDKEYEISITDFNSGHSDKFKTGSNANFRLNYDRLFEMEFTCKGCSTVIIDVDTYGAPIDNWVLIADILLYTTNQNRKKTGKIFYNDKDKAFAKEKY